MRSPLRPAEPEPHPSALEADGSDLHRVSAASGYLANMAPSFGRTCSYTVVERSCRCTYLQAREALFCLVCFLLTRRTPDERQSEIVEISWPCAAKSSAPLLVLRNLRPEPRGSLLNVPVEGILAAFNLNASFNQLNSCLLLAGWVGVDAWSSSQVGQTPPPWPWPSFAAEQMPSCNLQQLLCYALLRIATHCYA